MKFAMFGVRSQASLRLPLGQKVIRLNSDPCSAHRPSGKFGMRMDVDDQLQVRL